MKNYGLKILRDALKDCRNTKDIIIKKSFPNKELKEELAKIDQVIKDLKLDISVLSAISKTSKTDKNSLLKSFIHNYIDEKVIRQYFTLAYSISKISRENRLPYTAVRKIINESI